MKNTNFGIELEYTGITREEAAKVIAEYFNGTYRYAGTGYRTYEAKDNKGRIWKCMRDSSIRAQKKVNGRMESAGDEFKCEVVSPILSYGDIEDLQEIVRKLRKAGALVNSSMGLHIHISAEGHTTQTLRNLLNLVSSKEDLLYKALEVDPGRISYCKKVNKKMIAVLNQKKPKTVEELKDIWYAEDPHGCRESHYNSTRYRGLNIHATFTKKTIEYRMFNSTNHAGKVKAYIQFCLALNHQALTQKKASPRKTSTDNEKFTMRCWLLRLGLIGDEFKTCRHHLLKALKGNAAWRFTA